MNFAFAALAFIGLLAAVRVMLFGVERQHQAGDQTPRSFSVSPAMVAGFCVVAGVIGYVLAARGVTPTVTWISSLSAGLVASLFIARVVAQWWTVVPEHDVDDERYVLQGSLGQVIVDIAERGVGQVTLATNSPNRVLPARTIDDRPMAAGTEVVIERIEDGVAFVEDWAEVEKRL